MRGLELFSSTFFVQHDKDSVQISKALIPNPNYRVRYRISTGAPLIEFVALGLLFRKSYFQRSTLLI